MHISASEVYKFIRFLIVGGLGLCITLSLTYVFTAYIHIWYFWSFLVATFCAWTFVFFANAFFTFRDHAPLSVKRYIGFMASYLAVFWISGVVVYTSTSVLSVPYEISIVIGTITTTLFTFLISQFVIFPPIEKKDNETMA